MSDSQKLRHTQNARCIIKITLRSIATIDKKMEYTTMITEAAERVYPARY